MSTTAAPTEFSPLSTTREERGRQIARTGGIRPLGARYAVPSQSLRPDAPPTYLVDLVEQTCTCPDHAERGILGVRCKHQEAVLFWLAWEGTVSEQTGEVVLPKRRKTYKQNWPAYNAAQTHEKKHVEVLLRALCEGVEQPPRKPGAGRKPHLLRDAVFAAVMKVYTTLSGRRASTDIERCEERGHLDRAVHCSSVFRTMEDPATTPVLVRLIEDSAAPLAEVENAAGQFAQDSTGFSTVTYDRWFDQRHGKLRAEHAWVKLHVMVGTLTHVVTGVRVSSEADCPLLPALLTQTARTFRVREVSADKAYLSKKNLEAIEAVGAVPFIPFKSNSVGMASKSGPWKRMWCQFSLKSEEFFRHYHRRSNVETTMWMIKSKFGGSVRSRLPTAQANEVLAKVLCHNLACIVHAVAEFGIDAGFGKPRTAPVAEASTPTLVQS
jgi:transposase